MTFLPLPDEALAASLSEELAEVERRLQENAADVHPIVHDVANHLLAAGGKRIRPMLVLLTANLGKGVSDEVRQAAVATELTHLATLYHDDVMDSAALRRGAPSAHEVWGNSVAILAGDLLFARASQLVAELGPQAVRIQANAFERLVRGQLHETLGPGGDADPVEHYIQVLADKTGSLIAACAHLGSMLAGLDSTQIQATIDFAEKVGIAFQLADDVIDLSADAAATGKTPGTDLREGVDTMPTLLLKQQKALGTIDEEGESLLTRLQGDLSDDEVLAQIVQDLRAHSAVQETRELAHRWSEDAVVELKNLPESPARSALEDFATMVVERLA